MLGITKGQTMTDGKSKRMKTVAERMRAGIRKETCQREVMARSKYTGKEKE